jgi:hypothetical protein
MMSFFSPSHQKWLLLVVGLLAGFASGRYFTPGSAAGQSGSTATEHYADRNPTAQKSDGERSGPKTGGGRGESKEFGEAVRSIFRETIKERRVEQFDSMLARTDVSQFESLVALIRENDLRGNDSGEEWTRLWQAWGQRDPTAAFAFLRDHDWTGWDPNAMGEARNRALIGWAQTDPLNASRHVEGDEAFALGSRDMIFPLIRGWSEVDPEAAVAWLAKSGLGRSKEYEVVVEAINRRRGAEGLEAWFAGEIRSIASEQDRAGFAQAIANLKQEYEPEKAAAWVEQYLDEEWLPESEILESTASAFASRNPQDAMTWAAKTGIPNASIIAMATWCNQDIAAASHWMIDNAGDSAHAQAIPVVADFLMRDNPAAAKRWLETLPPSDLRETLLQGLDQ